LPLGILGHSRLQTSRYLSLGSSSGLLFGKSSSLVIFLFGNIESIIYLVFRVVLPSPCFNYVVNAIVLALENTLGIPNVLIYLFSANRQ
jgi:hypothetical protein